MKTYRQARRFSPATAVTFRPFEAKFVLIRQ